MFAGERLLHGAIVVLVSSLLKYLVFVLLDQPHITRTPFVHDVIPLTAGVFVGAIFSSGVLFAHTGLRVLNDLLLLRMTREHDWDDLW